jgi:hypothetical protein
VRPEASGPFDPPRGRAAVSGAAGLFRGLNATVVFVKCDQADVRNWSDPPAEFSLDGPFAAGSRGTTRMPGHPPNHWRIQAVEPGVGYTLEGGGFLDGAVMLFHWRFEALPGSRTKLSQRIELRGENAAGYVTAISESFGANLEPGLRRIAELMERAASRQ